EFRRVSTGILFGFMTLFNTIHLYTLATDFLALYNITVYSSPFVACRLHYFLQNATRGICAYLATAVALDRLIRSEMPMKSKHICTKRNAGKAIVFLLLFFCAIFVFWFLPYNGWNSNGTCNYNINAAYSFFLNQIFMIFRFVVIGIFPCIVMAMANFRMLKNIQQSRQRVGICNTVTIASVESTAHITKNSRSSMNPLQRQQIKLKKLSAVDRMLLLMMVTNVTTFIITQLPFHVYTVVKGYTPVVYDAYTYKLIRSMLLIWSSLYFGIGFYLYCLASPLFRLKFAKLDTTDSKLQADDIEVVDRTQKQEQNQTLIVRFYSRDVRYLLSN
ncbi:unnamed protein product, partial [Didymodactylos carnosus]